MNSPESRPGATLFFTCLWSLASGLLARQAGGLGLSAARNRSIGQSLSIHVTTWVRHIGPPLFFGAFQPLMSLLDASSGKMKDCGQTSDQIREPAREERQGESERRWRKNRRAESCRFL